MKGRLLEITSEKLRCKFDKIPSKTSKTLNDFLPNIPPMMATQQAADAGKIIKTNLKIAWESFAKTLNKSYSLVLLFFQEFFSK